MHRLVPVNSLNAIFPHYRNTPIEQLMNYHNLGAELPKSTGHAQMLIGLCMDHRKDLVLPNEFAYVLRSAGGNLRGNEFAISYAIAIGGITTIALLAHTDCGMTHVTQKRSNFAEGLTTRGGWNIEAAEKHFDCYAKRYDIGDSLSFVCEEARRLQHLYPKVLIAPLLYQVESDRLVQIEEKLGAHRG